MPICEDLKAQWSFDAAVRWVSAVRAAWLLDADPSPVVTESLRVALLTSE